MADVLLLGSTDVTRAVAEAVIESGVSLAGVVSLGESFSISYSPTPVANARYADMPGWCADHGVQAISFESNEKLLNDIGTERIAVCIVAGWYHKIPRALRERFVRGAIGFHASLLPQLRGGAPLSWAILAGLEETGLTMFQLTEGIDDGPVYGQRPIRIDARTHVGELVAASAAAATELVRECLPGIINGTAAPVAQSGTASYCLQRRPEDGRVAWEAPAETIDRLVRATGRPYPGAFTVLDGQKIMIWRSGTVAKPHVLGVPGQLVRLPDFDYPCTVTGDGLLKIVEATDESGTSVIDLLRKSSHKRFSAGA